jgi:hypothetical protein
MWKATIQALWLSKFIQRQSFLIDRPVSQLGNKQINKKQNKQCNLLTNELYKDLHREEIVLRNWESLLRPRYFWYFMEVLRAVLCSQPPVTNAWPEPVESSPYLHSVVLFTVLLHLFLPSGLFLIGFPTKILYKTLPPVIRVLRVPLLSF